MNEFEDKIFSALDAYDLAMAMLNDKQLEILHTGLELYFSSIADAENLTGQPTTDQEQQKIEQQIFAQYPDYKDVVELMQWNLANILQQDTDKEYH